MDKFYTDIFSGTSAAKFIGLHLNSEAVGEPEVILEHAMHVVAFGFWNMVEPQPLTQSEKDFNEQKALFEQIPPLFLAQYRGQFIVARNGRIVDADTDMDSLVDRFFSRHGEVPVYITKIGGEMREIIDTPFFD